MSALKLAISRMAGALLALLLISLSAAWMPHGGGVSSPGFANTFYVCPTGSNSNDGLSPATAWQTLAKVTAMTLSPSTEVLLCGTSTFNVTSPAPNSTSGAVTFVKARASGTAGNPIVLDVYNGSTATISDSGIGYTLINNGAPYFEVHDLTLTSTTAVKGILYFTNITNDLLPGAVINGNTVLGYKTNGTVAAKAIDINGSQTAGWTGYQINNNLVDGTTGLLDEGIAVDGSPKTTNGLIQGNIVHDIYGNATSGSGASGNGIILTQGTGLLMQYNLTYNLGRDTVTCGGPAGQWVYQAKNVTIQFGESYGAGPLVTQTASQTYNAGTGRSTITLASPANIIVGNQYVMWGSAPNAWNTIRYTALAGSNSTTIIAATTDPGVATVLGKVYAGGCDWNGFDLDDETNNSIIQYTYAHDNFGVGQVLFFQNNLINWHDNTFRYNIIETEDDATSKVSSCFHAGNGSGTVVNVNVYNNTCWSKETGTNKGSYITDLTGNVAGTNWYNNIFVSAGERFLYAPFQTVVGSVTFLNNDYYNSAGTFKVTYGASVYTSLAAWQATGQDATGRTSNPALASGGAGGTCSWTPSTTVAWPPSGCPLNYKLTAGSPMIGVGLNLTSAPYNFDVGSRDYYGNAIPHATGTGYNIGADGGLH